MLLVVLQMADADEIKKINDALTQAKGKRKIAAELLGITVNALSLRMHKLPEVMSLWGNRNRKIVLLKQADGEVVKLKVNEAEIAADHERQFARIVQPIMGTDAEATEMMALAKAYGQHSQLCESVIGGSVFERAIKLKKIADEVDAQVRKEHERGSTPEEMKALYEHQLGLHKALRDTAEMINRGRVANAKVKAIQDAGKGSHKGKTAFGPKQSQTNIVAQNVQVNPPA
jgi:hypothetical protein